MTVKPGPKERHEGMFQKGQSGNPNGRPKGAKNLNKLPRPERVLLSAEDAAIRALVAMSQNDFDKLKRTTEIPASVQLQAIQRVLDLIKEIKEKLAEMEEDEKPEDKIAQLFSTKAK